MVLRYFNTDVILDGNLVVTSGSFTKSLTVSGTPVCTAPLVVTGGMLYMVDNTRSGKLLSVGRAYYPFSNDGASDNVYLDCGSAQANTAGWVMPRNGTITSVTLYFVSGPTKEFQIRLNSSTTPLQTYNVNSATPTVSVENLDISANDRLQVFVGAAGSAAYDPTVSIEVAWRL